MSAPEVTYKDSLTVLGALPHLSPHPTATNIRALVIELVDKLTIIPSQQSPDLRYSEIIETDAVYALKKITGWKNGENPEYIIQ